MNFTSIEFLFLFFPLSLLAYYALRRISQRAGDVILTLAGLAFYAWFLIKDVFILLAYIVLLYTAGLIVHCISYKPDSDGERRKIMAMLVGLLLAVLFYFKYQTYVATAINSFTSLHLPGAALAAPLGISYIVFSSISYLVDIRRGEETPRSLLDTALFISFFPKVACGPIVRYKDFFSRRETGAFDLSLFYSGMNRLVLGMVKKLIFADYFGKVLSTMSLSAMDQLTALGSVILYSLQLYFDFAGYTDMAVGLGRMFGFRLPENFDAPYLSRSVTEFWRRWHMTLGAFFREYLYIPLGGNRKGTSRTLLNIAIVFLATGVWHGAGPSYLIWGGVHGLCVIVERLIRNKKVYQKTPEVLKWLFTTCVVFAGWQLFRFQDLGDAGALLSAVFRPAGGDITFTWQYYFNGKCLFFMAAAWLWSALPGLRICREWREKALSRPAWQVLTAVAMLGFLVIAVIYMVNSTYSPFIYFRY